MKTRPVLAVLFLICLSPEWLGSFAKATGRELASFSPEELIGQLAAKMHPRLLFSDWRSTPGYKHRTEKPYGGRAQWLFYVKSRADRQGGMYAAFYYQVSRAKEYAEKVKAELSQLGGPKRTDHVRLAGERMIDLALAYDWIQETLTYEEDAAIKARLASFADAVYQAYPKQANAHDRIMAASGLGAMALALAGYEPRTKSKPLDWLRDGTISLFIKDRFDFPPAFRDAPDYDDYCPALRGVCNRGGFCRLGAYKNYWVTTWCRWLLIYAKATGRNPLDDFPMARQIVDEPIWESMPNRMDSEQNTRKGKYWDYYRFLLPLLTPAERGGFRWYATDPMVDPLRRRRTTPGLDGVPWGLCCYEKDLATDAPFWTSFYSPSAEAIVFRRDWTVDADWLFFKCMNQPIPSHRDMIHHDNMSFELYSRGDYLVSDGGEIRKRMRGYGPEYACGHNTLLIDGVGPVKEDIQQAYYRFVNPARFTNAMLEPWLELGEAEMTVTHVERNPVRVVIGPSGARGSTEATETETNARPLGNPATWRRTILYPGNEYFLLIDAVHSRVKHDYDILFHLSSLNILKTTDRQHPGHVIGSLAIGERQIDWAKDVQSDILTGANPRRTIGSYDGGSRVLWNTTNLQGKPVVLRLVSSRPAAEITAGRIWGRVGETRPPYQGTFGGEVDHPFVSFHHTGSQLATITAILTRYADAEAERSVRPIATTGNGSALEVRRGSIADTIGTGQGELRYGDVVTDARVSLVRRRCGRLETVLLIDGTKLDYKNARWVAASDRIAHLAVHYENDAILGHVQSQKPVSVTIRCGFAPEEITYQAEPDNWIWVWSEELKERFSAKRVSFERKGEQVELRCPAGAGKLVIR